MIVLLAVESHGYFSETNFEADINLFPDDIGRKIYFLMH